MQFDASSPSGMRTEWKEAQVRSADAAARTVVLCGGSATEPDYEVTLADLSGARRVAGDAR